jgi:hypothetical protein
MPEVAKISSYEWDIFNNILCRIGGTLSIDKSIMIVEDINDEDLN